MSYCLDYVISSKSNMLNSSSIIIINIFLNLRFFFTLIKNIYAIAGSLHGILIFSSKSATTIELRADKSVCIRESSTDQNLCQDKIFIKIKKLFHSILLLVPYLPFFNCSQYDQ